MEVRIARSQQEREAIFRFRYQVYVEELKKQLPSADMTAHMVQDEEDESGILQFVEDEKGIVGTLRLNRLSDGSVSQDLQDLYGLDQFKDVPYNSIAVASRFVVRSTAATAGHVLSQHGLGWALGNAIKLVFSYCSPHMVASYEQIGFRRYKDNFNDPVGYRIPMLLVLFDKVHLRRVGSPLYARIEQMEAGTVWNKFFRERFTEYDLPINSRLYPQDEFWSLLSRKLNSNPLESIPLFHGLSSELAATVMEAGTVISLKTGDQLLSAGETGKEFYLILQGLMGVFLPRVPKPITLLGPGEIVGEMAFLGNAPRSADVQVLRDSEVMVLSELSFLNLANSHPMLAGQVSMNLARILSERLAVTSKALAEVQRELV